jgi:hypothetical protein
MNLRLDTSRSLATFGLAALLVSCAGTALTRESLRPIPEHSARRESSPTVRGTARDAGRIAPDQEYHIIAEVIRRFYRPMMQQARWIDPRPLAHVRTMQADTVAQAEPDWAIAIVEAANVARVCPLTEANERCRGRPGGVLRFSRPYAVGGAGPAGVDSAIVYARYAPVAAGPVGEMEFFVVRRAGEWYLTSRRSMPEIIAGTPVSAAAVVDPREAMDSLLAADRAFSAAAKNTDLVTGISRMFLGNVLVQAPTGFVAGRDSAIKGLETNPDSRRSRVQWTPVGGGVSSDGEHGFTYGYASVTRPDGSVQPHKYMGYWVRGETGWRVAVYKTFPRATGEASLAMHPPSLPTRALPRGDETTVQRYADELSRAEHAFSRDAGPMGIGPAFEKWGAPDAVNTGGARSVEFVRGNKAIAQSVAAGHVPGSEITWAPEQVIVSRTGDLGVTIGTIKIVLPATADARATTRTVPFFTIWKRAWPSDPWRYVGE